MRIARGNHAKGKISIVSVGFVGLKNLRSFEIAPFSRCQQDVNRVKKGVSMYPFELKDGMKVKFTYLGNDEKESFLRRWINGEWDIAPAADCADYKKTLGLAPEAVRYLRPAEGFWPVPGDVIANEYGTHTILAWIDRVYFISMYDKPDEAAEEVWTREELIEGKFRIVDKEPPSQVTIGEAEHLLEEKFGKPVKIVVAE